VDGDGNKDVWQCYIGLLKNIQSKEKNNLNPANTFQVPRATSAIWGRIQHVQTVASTCHEEIGSGNSSRENGSRQKTCEGHKGGTIETTVDRTRSLKSSNATETTAKSRIQSEFSHFTWIRS